MVADIEIFEISIFYVPKLNFFYNYAIQQPDVIILKFETKVNTANLVYLHISIRINTCTTH